MLHNIFTKKRKNIIQNKPRIIVDIYEKNSLVPSELINNPALEIIYKPLKIGDYIVNKTIIERKEINDFYSSLITKRLDRQIINLKKNKNKLIILEGEIKNIKKQINPNLIYGKILSITLKENIPIIFAKNHIETAAYMTILAKKQNKNIEINLHNKSNNSKQDQKKYILKSFPEIGPITADKLLKKFKTLENIFNANEIDLTPILKNKTKNFLKLIKQ